MVSEFDVYILLKLGRRNEAEAIAERIVSSMGINTSDPLTFVLQSLVKKLAHARIENAIEEGIYDRDVHDRIIDETLREIMSVK